MQADRGAGWGMEGAGSGAGMPPIEYNYYCPHLFTSIQPNEIKGIDYMRTK
jgi:hypothetical protein